MVPQIRILSGQIKIIRQTIIVQIQVIKIQSIQVNIGKIL